VLAPAAHDDKIPGIPGAELDIMESAAVRVLGPQRAEKTAIPALRRLQLPARPGAAGQVSEQRELYNKKDGTHFMFMGCRS